MKRTKELVIICFFLLAGTYLAWATVSSQTTKVYFTCNGSTTTFSCTGGNKIPCFASTDIEVYVRTGSTGVEELLTITTDYSVSALNNDYTNGFTVTTVQTYASGQTLVVKRAIALTQEVNLIRGRAIPQEAMEKTLDRQVLALQDSKEELGRAIRIPVTDSSYDMKLPNSIDRASKYLAFGATGDPALTEGTTSDIVVSSFMETFVDDATGHAGLTTLGGIQVLNVRTYGALGNGSTDDYSAINDAVTAAGSEGDIYFPEGTYKISSDITFGNSLNLVFSSGALLSPDSSKTVTLKTISAGNYQIITGSGTVSFVDGTKINTIWYSSSGDGTSTSRWVDGLRNAFAANGAYHHYTLPGGEYQDVTTIDLDGSGFITISGDGVGVTKIFYGVADTTSAIKIHNSGSPVYNVFVRDISFWGESTCTGAALEIEDLRDQGAFERLEIYQFKGSTSAKGLWLKGCNIVKFDNILIGQTAICVHVDANPNHVAALNYVTFSNMNLYGYDSDYSYGYKIEALQFYNTLIFRNAFSLMKYGIYFSPGPIVPADNVYTFSIRDSSFEQGDSTNKDCWAIYLDAGSTQPMYGITIDNVDFGSSYKGLYLRYCDAVTITGSQFIQNTGYTQFDLGANCNAIAFFNCLYAVNGTQTIGLSTVYSRREIIAAGFGTIGYELYDKTAQIWTGRGPTLLSTTTIPLNANGDTTIYTVPTGNRCMLSHAYLVVGADASTSDISIGANGAETDFVGVTNLDNLNAQYDMILLAPIPSATPATLKSYAAATVIEAQVANQAGGATNTLYLFGTLY